MYSLYLMPMLVSFCLCIIFLVAFIFSSKKSASKEVRSSARHIHDFSVSRFGGIALILSFCITLILDKNLVLSTPLIGVLFCLLLILFFGLYDDLKPVHWKYQLFFQILLVIIVSIMGVRIQFISNPFGGIISFPQNIGHVIGLMVAVFWIIFLINAMNWVDGVDGISGGVAMIAIATIFILSLRPEVNQPPIAIISAALFGCLAAFLLLNFYPAKIMAGTSGSMFMGFMLAVLAFFAGAKIATTLLVLSVPVLDALWVIVERYKSGNSIFLADQRHLHYRLMQLGWSQKGISLFYYLITLTVSIIALNTRAIGKIFAFSLFVALSIYFMICINKKIKVQKIKI